MADLLSSHRPSALSRLSQTRGASLFFFSAAGALTMVLAAVGGIIALRRVQELRQDEFIAQNKIKEESVRPELLQQIGLLDARLKGARALLDEHLLASNVFGVIEKNTHPQVRFLNFTFSADSGKLDMSGEAASYRALSRQIALFEGDPQVERAEFGGLSTTGEGLVGFKISLSFKPSLLRLRQ